jgi:hypothetical protein
MSEVADVKSWKICLKVNSKREEPQEQRRFWKGGRKCCNGGVAKACGSFLYLGSLTDKKGSSGPEIRRRIKKARRQLRLSEDFGGFGQ